MPIQGGINGNGVQYHENSALFETDQSFSSGNFHLIISDSIWPWVTEMLSKQMRGSLVDFKWKALILCRENTMKLEGKACSSNSWSGCGKFCMNLTMFFCPLFPRKIMWGFVCNAVDNSCWLVLLYSVSQRKPPSPARNRCSVSSEVVESRVAVLYGISPRLGSVPLRLIQFHCSTSPSINPLSLLSPGCIDCFMQPRSQIFSPQRDILY